MVNILSPIDGGAHRFSALLAWLPPGEAALRPLCLHRRSFSWTERMSLWEKISTQTRRTKNRSGCRRAEAVRLAKDESCLRCKAIKESQERDSCAHKNLPTLAGKVLNFEFNWSWNGCRITGTTEIPWFVSTAIRLIKQLMRTESLRIVFYGFILLRCTQIYCKIFSLLRMIWRSWIAATVYSSGISPQW